MDRNQRKLMGLFAAATACAAVLVWTGIERGTGFHVGTSADAEARESAGAAEQSAQVRPSSQVPSPEPIWNRPHAPANGPTIRGPKIATKAHFDTAVVAAARGDAIAARELALTTNDCATIMYKFSDRPPPPLDSVEPRLRDFATYEAARYEFCRQIGRDALDLRGKWMADAAKAGDRYAVLNLRFYPPLGKHAAEERVAWSTLVVDLLLKLGNDGEALSTLARIHADGVVVPRDLDIADQYLQRTLEVASPDSNEYKFAALMRERLRLIRSRKSPS